MSPITRRVLQAVLYEVIAIAVVGPVLSLAFDKPQASTFGLAVALATIALTWNYAFNWFFERWESRQAVRGRSFARRVTHGAGFEGGLVVILVPVMSLCLNISLAAAFVTNLGLLVFFFVYAIVFTWAFDRVFGLPASAVKNDFEAVDA
ncbi:MAG: PACE efflux transporter [Ramlibacter sp.]|nr:PACE efflux transporter [Ramlibacter sp.]